MLRFSLILTFSLFACKGVVNENNSQTRSDMTATHSLATQVQYNLALTYEVTANSGEKISPETVTVKQVASDEFTSASVDTTGKIIASSDAANKDIPRYEINIKLPTGENCVSIEPVYLNAQDAKLSCSKVVSTEEASAVIPAPDTSAVSAPECTDSLVIDEFIRCRYFNGGFGGCVDKWSCKVSLTEMQCQIEQDRLAADPRTSGHTTAWLCSER